MAGIAGSLLGNMTKAGESPATSLVALMILTSASLLWCLFSLSGYSRRHFPYKVTIVTDLIFLIAFGVFSVLLGLPMHDGGTKCPRVKAEGGFVLRAGPLGVLNFSSEPNDRVSCTKIYLFWVLMLVDCASFVLSAASVGVIASEETQFNKALLCARAMSGPVGDIDYHRRPSEISVAGLEEVVSGAEQQFRPRPNMHVRKRSLDSGNVAHGEGRSGGGTYHQADTVSGNPYRVDTTSRLGTGSSRYDCSPRVDSSLGSGSDHEATSGRSLGNPVLQRGSDLINTYNRKGLANNRELVTEPPPKPVSITVLQARSDALDQLEGRSSASIDLADAPYYRDLYAHFAQPRKPSGPGPGPGAVPDNDSRATPFTNTNRYNPQEQTHRKWKKQRPSGIIFLPSSSDIPSSPIHHPHSGPDPDPVSTVKPNIYTSNHNSKTTQIHPTQARTRSQTQTRRQHDSYTSSVDSSPSNYDDTRFNHRDLPSPVGLDPPPRSSLGAIELKYSLPPRPRTTLRLVDQETLNKLEGINEEKEEVGSAIVHMDGWHGHGDAVIELNEIPILPVPAVSPGRRAPGTQLDGRTERKQQVWEWEWGQRSKQQEVEQTQSAGRRAAGEARGARSTRWPAAVWGVGLGSVHGRRDDDNDDEQCDTSRMMELASGMAMNLNCGRSMGEEVTRGIWFRNRALMIWR
ncbi:hypothetical protein GE21DRAFT_1990 [Neurospora crassa]|uniref:Uncharacterized protein n=1 Tax=Neurospora crassa (strain ATCC 24698 / 74-OR23-1A / CBS 708.71 / DSM 1257 / FGSC 987) TaxID=367110 RepID=Q7SES2_NEUCR|nr:hypothetical protein NCU00724 [Neurospora crassa OR74A]EAA35322.1 hypothetical protein NCU00724 [Neurospora crassa OR74A]KHE89723.1 hypothetical protein GE21DRAFT_1990 [Neurospora crassa]|eukprot:XP_964558.1 hypothetical protein NCU00724 [Neurospora crassa OR74A]